MIFETLPAAMQAVLRDAADKLLPLGWPERYRVVCQIVRTAMPAAVVVTGGHVGLAREIIGARIGALIECWPDSESPTCLEHALLLGLSSSVAHVDAGRRWLESRPEQRAMAEAVGATRH